MFLPRCVLSRFECPASASLVQWGHQKPFWAWGAWSWPGPADSVGLQRAAAHIGKGWLEKDGLHGQSKPSQQQHQGQWRPWGQHSAAHRQRSGSERETHACKMSALQGRIPGFYWWKQIFGASLVPHGFKFYPLTLSVYVKCIKKSGLLTVSACSVFWRWWVAGCYIDFIELNISIF